MLQLASLKKSSFFSKKPIFSLQKNQLMNVLRLFTISVASYEKHSIFSKNLKIEIFFQKSIFFRNYPKFWTFWEVLLLQSHSTTNLQLLPIFKKFFFFKKSINYSGKKRTFWEIVIFPPHSPTNLLILAISKKLKSFAKTFFDKLWLLNVLRVLHVSVAFFGIFATFTKISKTGKKFQKPVSASQQTQDLNGFRSRAVSVTFYSKLLHLPISRNWKNSKNPSLLQKKPKPGRFEKSYFFRTHSTSISLLLAICKEIRFFHWKIKVF